MSPHFEYSFEKFNRAAFALAASHKSIKIRLSDAVYHLTVLREHHIPAELRNEFNNLINRLTSCAPQNREGTFQATVNQITDEEAVKYAGEIVSLHHSLYEWQISDARKR